MFGQSPAADSPIASVQFNYPEDAVEAADGTIYVSDTQSHVIKRISGGVASVFAGTFVAGSNGDGARLSTQLNLPIALQLSADGRFLIFSDAGNYLLRRIELANGAVSTIAGVSGNAGIATDGTSARGNPIGYIRALHLDGQGNLWFPATGTVGGASIGGLFYIDPSGTVRRRTVAASAGDLRALRDIYVGNGYLDLLIGDRFARVRDDGTVSQIVLRSGFGKGLQPIAGGMLIGEHTTLSLVDDTLGKRIISTGFANISNIKRTQQGYLITDSDRGVLYRYDGTALTQLTGTGGTSLGALTSVVRYTDTSVLILDNQRPRIFLLDLTTGQSTLWAGTGKQAFATINVDKLATDFFFPNSLAVDAAKNVYVLEQNRVMKIDGASGQVSLLAGTDLAGDADGTFTAAQFRSPAGIAVDAQGNVIVADTYNNKVRKITSAGTVTTIAGTGSIALPSFSGPATQSALNRPQGLLVMPDGRILIADAWNNAVYALGIDGVLRSFAGRPNLTGYQGGGVITGDGGRATDAGLNTPVGLALGADGSVYIADQFNHRIRKVTTGGVISTFAGVGQGFAPEGRLLNFPTGMSIIGDQLFVADSGNRLIIRYYL